MRASRPHGRGRGSGRERDRPAGRGRATPASRHAGGAASPLLIRAILEGLAGPAGVTSLAQDGVYLGELFMRDGTIRRAAPD